MKKIFNFSAKNFGIYASITFCMLIFSNACIDNFIFPFAAPLTFALVVNNIYSIYSIAIFFICSLVHGFTFENVVSSALVVSLLIIFVIVKRFSKKHHFLFAIIFCAFSRIANIYFLSYSVNSIIWAIVDLILSATFVFVLNSLIFAFVSRGIQAFAKKERIFFYMCLIICFMGLSNIYLYKINVSNFIFILFILCSVAAFKEHSIISIFCLTCGYALSAFNFVFIPLYFLAMTSLIFRGKYKWVCAGYISLVSSLLLYLNDNINLFEFLPIIFACITYLCVPNKWLNNIEIYLFGSQSSIISSYILEKQKSQAKNKLLSISLMFDEMHKCYRSLASSNLNINEELDYLASNIKSSVCARCINQNNCYNSKDMFYQIRNLLELAIKKDKVNLLDIPTLIASNCTKLNSIIENVNALASEYHESLKLNKTDGENKLASSVQFAGTSLIFKEISETFETKYHINSQKSLLLKDLIVKNNIVCKECIALEDKNGIKEINMVVRNIDAVNPVLEDICKQAYHIAFYRKENIITKYAGWSLVSLIPTENYELLCGVACSPKKLNDKSGDNYVFKKLGDGKFLLAISDGMGHGEGANNISSVAISLLQSLYMAGLSSPVIMDSINSLLLPANSGFTTIDATVVDTCSGVVDFIKMGSTISVIRQNNQTKIIDVESLPLGVTEKVCPTYKKTLISTGDIVVLASDGIVDAFGQKNFCDYINNEVAINMQVFAEGILEEATARAVDHKDDMTVIAYKLSPKR